MPTSYVSPNDIRHQFSLAMSDMYQKEVPLYSDLLDLVHQVNAGVLAKDEQLKQQLAASHELERIDLERHGAIRLGTAQELATMCRLFAVMGMQPVGYYDLSVAGVPVHSTAFRALDSEDLQVSPFRVFTSLLRLELIEDESLREEAKATLQKRQIFNDKVLQLIEKAEKEGGLNQTDADEFVAQALETFRWHQTAPVSKALYERLNDSHRLIADVVGFQGPHINHLTPRTLDIDAVQVSMDGFNIPAKEIIEGPPRRQCPILLRQTSFKALNEKIHFAGDNSDGNHTARFGEIEQRGVALTEKGRDLYDELLNKAREELGIKPESNPDAYYAKLSEVFSVFPDDYKTMHHEKLAYFYYHKNGELPEDVSDINALVDSGVLSIVPIVYEDFLPVSAAGIFQSNLGEGVRDDYGSVSNQDSFEQALGQKVNDITAMYDAMQAKSLAAALA
ncbi:MULTISPECIES: VOC family protein [unclassified Acinetobacter]|uniref:2-oxoadipate dioxygenase/decarboxylase HglS n=1 Tax=unclassified Acinetobacter TaxID=196816 RepID=UPI0035B6F776